MGRLSFSVIFAGIIAAVVGFASSFAVLVQGYTAVGASIEQATSGLMMAAIVMGIGGITASLKSRMPISIVWSMPGAAFLISSPTPEGGFAVAVGAFLLSGVLLTLSGLWKPLGRLVAKIPPSLAGAMLAGVLLHICLRPFQAMVEFPYIAVPIFIVWLVVAQFNRLFAVPSAVLAAAVLIAYVFGDNINAESLNWAPPVLIAPQFTLESLTGIAIPLFIITMASQNITGIAVLTRYGYRPDASKIFGTSGFFSLLAAPFGTHALNLAAITAAITADENCHPDPKRRYWGVVVSGIVYISFGLTAGYAVSFISLSPPILIAAVAGLALMPALASALEAALSEPQQKLALMIAFLITASGVSFFGISGAFWGLVVGGAVYYLNNLQVIRKEL